MPAVHHVPEPDDVGRLLTGLFGKPVRATRVPDAVAGPVIAVYGGDGGAAGAAVACELPLAAALGAALAMIPPGAAAEAARSGSIPDHLAENLHEVLNVGSRLFNSGSTPRIGLRSVLEPGIDVPEDVADLLRAPAGEVRLVVAVPGYPEGKLTCAVR